MEQIKTFAKKKYDTGSMKQISRLYENDYPDFLKDMMLRKKLTGAQMTYIIDGYEKGIPESTLKIYANPSIPSWNMRILNIISDYGVSEECIRLCANTKFTLTQMAMLCDIITGNPDFNFEQIKIIANPLLSDDQMEIIEDGFRCGLSIEQIKTFAKPEMAIFTMNTYKDCYIAGIKDVNLYVNIMEMCLNRSEEYKKELIRAAAKGFSLTKIKLLAEKNLSTEQLRFIIDSTQTNIPQKEKNNKKETRKER